MLKDKENNLTTICHRWPAIMINVMGPMANSTKGYIYQHNKSVKDKFIAIVNIIGSCNNTYIKGWVLNISREKLLYNQRLTLMISTQRLGCLENTLKGKGCFPKGPEFNSQAFTCQLTIVLNTRSWCPDTLTQTNAHIT